MSIGSTTGVLPAAPLTSSLILGDNLATLQAAWTAPVNADQALWIANIQGRANQSVGAGVPATFSQAALEASIAQAAGLRYAMTGNAADLNKAVAALVKLDVPGGTHITRPEALTSYLSAYDFIRMAPEVDLPAATRSLIEGRLLAQAQSLDDGNNTYSNARAKVGATRGLAGLLLADQPLLDLALDDLAGHFVYSTTDDGWFTDGHGHYLNYTLRHVGLFARAYQQGSGVDLYANLQPYADMSIGLRMPDGGTPNVSNGLHTPVAIHLLSGTSDLEARAEMLWYASTAPTSPYPWASITNVLNNDGSYASFFALVPFDAAPQAPDRSPTFFAPGQSQVTVFRHDWGPQSDYLLLSPGIDSPPWVVDPNTNPPLEIPAFHAHNDTAEIQLAARGQYILVAPGYERDDLSNSPSPLDSKYPHWHNVVLVDGTLGTGIFGVLDEGMRMRPEDFEHTHRLDSTEYGGYAGVSDFATLRTRYNGVDVTRSIAFPGEDYFVVADQMDGDAVHEYGFNLVGRGTQTVLVDTPERMAVRWEYGGAQVIEHLVSTHAMALSTDSQWMHVTFNQFEPTQRMYAAISASDAQFLSVLETGEAGAPSQLSIEKLSAASDYLAIRVAHAGDGWLDTILSQPGNQLRTAGALTSDARYAYVRALEDVCQAAMMAQGTQFAVDGQMLFESDAPLTLSLLLLDDEVLGTVSADALVAGTELRIFDRGEIVSATLDGTPLAFFNSPQYGSIWLPAGGVLSIQFAAVPEPATLVLLATGAALIAAGRWPSRSRRRG